MPEHYSKRTGYAPWSLTREAGVQSATVNSDIEVPQVLQPVLNTGFIDEKGDWKGTKSSDEQFIGITRAESIANGADALFPDTPSHPSIDMTGFTDMFIAIKPTAAGGVAIEAVMGPDTVPFANLSPVNAAAIMRGVVNFDSQQIVEAIFVDSIETLVADVWNIFVIQKILAEQKNMQFKVTNNSGAFSTIEFGFMRLV